MFQIGYYNFVIHKIILFLILSKNCLYSDFAVKQIALSDWGAFYPTHGDVLPHFTLCVYVRNCKDINTHHK